MDQANRQGLWSLLSCMRCISVLPLFYSSLLHVLHSCRSVFVFTGTCILTEYKACDVGMSSTEYVMDGSPTVVPDVISFDREKMGVFARNTYKVVEVRGSYSNSHSCRVGIKIDAVSVEYRFSHLWKIRDNGHKK